MKNIEPLAIREATAEEISGLQSAQENSANFDPKNAYEQLEPRIVKELVYKMKEILVTFDGLAPVPARGVALVVYQKGHTFPIFYGRAETAEIDRKELISVLKEVVDNLEKPGVDLPQPEFDLKMSSQKPMIMGLEGEHFIEAEKTCTISDTLEEPSSSS